MLLITFVELRVVAGRSRTRAGRPHAVYGRPMLIHAHAALFRGLNRSLSERHSRGMARVQHDMCESNKAALCKSNRKDTFYTLRGTAEERHAMCKLAFIQNSDAGKRGNGQQRGTSTCVSRKSPPSQLVRDWPGSVSIQ
jgi:hypothetical protein